jgi:nitrous oxidase accessory protein NosD
MAIEPRVNEAENAAELQQAIDEAKDGAVIPIGPGRIRGRIIINKSITLRGAGAERTIIDAKGRGCAIAVDAKGGDVRIEEMSITGGRASHGGGISVDNGASVFVVGCLIEKNSARAGQGGAIAVDRGALYVAECTLVQNQARMGGGIFIGGDAKCEIAASIVAENMALHGGGVAVLDGAEVDIFTSRLLQNRAEIEGHHIFTRGVSHRAPSILLSNTVLDQADAVGFPVSNYARDRATLVIDNTMVAREFVKLNVLV